MSKAAVKVLEPTLFEVEEYDVDPSFEVDDYETPDGTGDSMKLGQAFAGLVSHAQGDKILDCSAGSGRVAQFLPRASTCIEIRPDRVPLGEKRAPDCLWHCGNFLKMSLQDLQRTEGFQYILSNLPFSIALDFIAHSQTFLAPRGMLLFLLPVNYFSTNEHADGLAVLEAQGLRRTHIHQIRGRVSYLKGNVAIRGRQCDDAIHVFTWDDRCLPAITTLKP